MWWNRAFHPCWYSWRVVLVLGTPVRDFLWNGLTEEGCGSTKVESRLENSAVGTNPKNSRLGRSVEAGYISVSWMLEGRFPVPCCYQWMAESVNRICGLHFVYEQILKRTLLGQQCLYGQRHSMLYEHPNFRNHLIGKLLLFPSRYCVFSGGAPRCKNLTLLCQQ